MASILFRHGANGVESVTVEYDQFEAHLSYGWAADLDEKPAEMSDDDVREAAKEAGIEGWDTKRVKTLRAALEG